jgi:hypothetical protein
MPAAANGDGGASAAKADADAEQMSKGEGPIVVPLEGASEGVQAGFFLVFDVEDMSNFASNHVEW